jgi:hypothetical protein
VGVGLSNNLDVAFQNAHMMPDAHLTQGDVLWSRSRPERFNHEFSLGALHPAPVCGRHSPIGQLATHRNWIVIFMLVRTLLVF